MGHWSGFGSESMMNTSEEYDTKTTKKLSLKNYTYANNWQPEHFKFPASAGTDGRCQRPTFSRSL